VPPTQEIELATSDQEEMATFYAGIAQDGPQLGNPRTAEVFNRNFFRDFKTILGPAHVIQEFSKCDFGPIRAYLDAKKEEKKALTKDDKDKAKAEKEALTRKYGFAILDNNRIEKLGNTTIEPPGLFRGRGEHPRMGSLKQRVMPEDITINIARGACVRERIDPSVGFRVVHWQGGVVVVGKMPRSPSAPSLATTGRKLFMTPP
jgi:DNA topoisomerase I